jgi:hypothetical protein
MGNLKFAIDTTNLAGCLVLAVKLVNDGFGIAQTAMPVLRRRERRYQVGT